MHPDAAQGEEEGHGEAYNPDDFEHYELGEFLKKADDVDWTEDYNEFCERRGLTLKELQSFVKFMRNKGLNKEVEYEKYDWRNLNKKQKRAYELITQWCIKAIQGKVQDLEPLRLIIQGTFLGLFFMTLYSDIFFIFTGRAGCGKSYLINCVAKFLAETMKSPNFMKIAAPTGKLVKVK